MANLKKRIMDVEEKMKSRTGKGIAVIKADSESEFQKKKMEYLQTHPEPEFFIFLRYFSRSDCLDPERN